MNNISNSKQVNQIKVSDDRVKVILSIKNKIYFFNLFNNFQSEIQNHQQKYSSALCIRRNFMISAGKEKKSPSFDDHETSKNSKTFDKSIKNAEKLPFAHSLAILDVHNFELIHKFCVHRKTITNIKIFENDELLVSISEDWSIKLFNIQKKQFIRNLQFPYDKNTKEIYFLKVFPYQSSDKSKNHFVVNAKINGKLRVWNINEERIQKSFKSHKQRISALKLSKCKKLAITIGFDQTICVYDLNKFKIIKDLKQDFSSFYSEIKIFCIYEKNPLKLIIYYQGNIELWDVKNKIITNKGENFFLDEGIDKLLKKRRENQMFESLGTLSQKTNKKYKKMNFLAFGNNFCYGLSTKNQVFR